MMYGPPVPYAQVNGIELEYESRGEGEPLVLIMGFASQRIYWPEELIDLLVGAGFRVISFDNRDVGRSTKLDHLGVPDVRRALLRSVLGRPTPAPYTIGDMAGDVVGLLDALDIPRAHVVGASMGGMMAQELAIAHPERLLTMTSIMSTPGGRRYSLGKPSALVRLFAKPATTRDEHAQRAVESFTVLAGPGFPIDESRMRALALAAWDRGIHPKGAARQLAAVLDPSADRRARLAGVRVPTLVMHGTEDPLLPERAGRATAKMIPGARYLPIPGMGHSFPVEAMPLIAGAVHSLAMLQRRQG